MTFGEVILTQIIL